MGKLIDVVITAALACVLIGCFSLAPQEVTAPTYDRPGLQAPGESGLVITGGGSERLTVSQTEPTSPWETVTATTATETQDDPGNRTEGTEPTELAQASFWHGVWAVLLGQVVLAVIMNRRERWTWVD